MDRPGVLRPLRVLLGVLLGAEAALAMWMTVFVGEVAPVFPSPSRYVISTGGVLGGLTLVVYAATLGLVTLASLGQVTDLQQRLRTQARRVHVAVGVVASIVYVLAAWMIQILLIAPPTLIVLALTWSRVIEWTLAPRPHEVEAARRA